VRAFITQNESGAVLVHHDDWLTGERRRRVFVREGLYVCEWFGFGRETRMAHQGLADVGTPLHAPATPAEFLELIRREHRRAYQTHRRAP
jgi:hypothetical protein